jgi:hypothetical protein
MNSEEEDLCSNYTSLYKCWCPKCSSFKQQE